MSRKLPLCAYCGETLVRRGRCIIEYGDISHAPQAGWCLEGKKGQSCLAKDVKQDEKIKRLWDSWGGNKKPIKISNTEIILLLNHIKKRGLGRITFRK